MSPEALEMRRGRARDGRGERLLATASQDLKSAEPASKKGQALWKRGAKGDPAGAKLIPLSVLGLSVPPASKSLPKVHAFSPPDR
jgi:hypothetical protein